MRFFLLVALFGVLSAVLESTWLSNVPTSSVHFDFILIAVAALSFNFEWKTALPAVVLLALIMDSVSAQPFGISLFSFVVIYGLVRLIIFKISFQTGPALLFWVAAISLIDKALRTLVLVASMGDFSSARVMWEVVPFQAPLDAVTSLAIVPFLGWYWNLTWEKLTRPSGLVMR